MLARRPLDLLGLGRLRWVFCLSVWLRFTGFFGLRVLRQEVVGLFMLIIGFRQRAGVQVMARPGDFGVFVHLRDTKITTLVP